MWPFTRQKAIIDPNILGRANFITDVNNISFQFDLLDGSGPIDYKFCKIFYITKDGCIAIKPDANILTADPFNFTYASLSGLKTYGSNTTVLKLYTKEFRSLHSDCNKLSHIYGLTLNPWSSDRAYYNCYDDKKEYSKSFDAIKAAVDNQVDCIQKYINKFKQDFNCINTDLITLNFKGFGYNSIVISIKPCNVNKYIEYLKAIGITEHIDGYRNYIIEELANKSLYSREKNEVAKRNIQYDEPIAEIDSYNSWHRIYLAQCERIRKNKENEAIINEIDAKRDEIIKEKNLKVV